VQHDERISTDPYPENNQSTHYPCGGSVDGEYHVNEILQEKSGIPKYGLRFLAGPRGEPSLS
jgi:hypothetical protein